MRKTYLYSMLLGMCLMGCAASPATGTDGADTSAATWIEIGDFTDEAIADSLGSSWNHVAEGVFEKYGDDGSMQRIAVGRSGLLADAARFRAERDEYEVALAGRPSTTVAEDEHVRMLGTRVAGLESLLAGKDAQALERNTSDCFGDVFFVESEFQNDGSGSSMWASAGWEIGFGPRIPSQSYAYAGVFDDGWPIRARERYGDSDTPAWAVIVSTNFYRCTMYAYTWVSPTCSEACLSLTNYGDCGTF